MPSTLEYDLIWRQGFYTDNQVKMWSLGWALIQYDWQRGNDMKRQNVGWQAEIGVMQSKAKEPPGLPETRRGREEAFLSVFRRSVSLLTL